MKKKIDPQLIVAGEDFTIIDFSYNRPLMQWIFDHGDKISIEICYKSVFGDCFLMKRAGFQSNLEVTSTGNTEACAFPTGELFME